VPLLTRGRSPENANIIPVMNPLTAAGPSLSLTLSKPTGVEAIGSAFIAGVLPTSSHPSQGPDAYTAQYAPETYAVALSAALTPSIVGSSALKEPVVASSQNIDPTYAGTNLPYLDHELEKIDATYQGNATLTPPPPTFASDPPPSDPPPASDPPPPTDPPPAAVAPPAGSSAPPTVQPAAAAASTPLPAAAQ
jgi:hypothetical protein